MRGRHSGVLGVPAVEFAAEPAHGGCDDGAVGEGGFVAGRGLDGADALDAEHAGEVHVR